EGPRVDVHGGTVGGARGRRVRGSGRGVAMMTRPGRMRVGMNLLWLLPGVAGGAERYATRLLRALADEARDEVDLTIFCNRRFPPAHEDLTARLSTAVAPLDGRSRAVRIAMESSWLAREAARR